MAVRHDSMDMVTEAQRKASDKYQKTNIQQIILKLNIKTDMDIIRHFWHINNKQGYLKELIRADIEKQKKGNLEQ